MSKIAAFHSFFTSERFGAKMMYMEKQRMKFQIDHIVVAGSNLDKLVADFSAAGLRPDAGGTHADGLTHNALIGFADGSYIELIAPVPGRDASTHTWGAFMAADVGVCAYAVRSADVHADVERLRTEGYEVAAAVPGGRTRPDGVRLEWITAQMDSNPLGSHLPFLIQDTTPRENRVPYTESAAPFAGVGNVLLNVNDELIPTVIGAFLTVRDLELVERRYKISAPLRYQGRPAVRLLVERAVIFLLLQTGAI